MTTEFPDDLPGSSLTILTELPSGVSWTAESPPEGGGPSQEAHGLPAETFLGIL